jgi:hypothetical protein
MRRSTGTGKEIKDSLYGPAVYLDASIFQRCIPEVKKTKTGSADAA